jgi:hypothetical protein
MILDRAVKFAAARAARIIAVSQFTRDEIVELYDADSDRIRLLSWLMVSAGTSHH